MINQLILIWKKVPIKMHNVYSLNTESDRNQSIASLALMLAQDALQEYEQYK